MPSLRRSPVRGRWQPCMTHEIERAAPWLLGQLSEWEQWVLRETLSLSLSPSFSLSPSPSSFRRPPLRTFPPRLPPGPANGAASSSHRNRLPISSSPKSIGASQRLRPRGRPRPILQAAIRSLQFRFLLDPATGTGCLPARGDRPHASALETWRDDGSAGAGDQRVPLERVRPSFSPRLYGIEILPGRRLLSQTEHRLKLAPPATNSRQPGHINILLGDALAPSTQSEIQNPKSKIQNSHPSSAILPRQPIHQGQPWITGSCAATTKFAATSKPTESD